MRAARSRSRSFTVDLDGHRLFSLTLGRESERLPVVLVPGLGLSHRYMLPLAEELAQETQVFLFDPPGTGASSLPARALTVTEHADLLARWMESVGAPRAVLAGNSLGCHVIVRLAHRHPLRALGAVLIGMPLAPHARRLGAQFARLVHAGLHEPLALWRIVVVDYLRAGILPIAQTFSLALRDRAEQWLPHIEAPVLVVRGDRDPLLDSVWAQQIVEALPQGALVELPGVAHAANFEAPALVARHMAPLLERTHLLRRPASPWEQPSFASTPT